MANEYKSIYLKDLIMTITSIALDSMMTPCLENKKTDGTQMTLSEISAYNSLVAWHNEGVHELANNLIEKLMKGDDDD